MFFYVPMLFHFVKLNLFFSSSFSLQPLFVIFNSLWFFTSFIWWFIPNQIKWFRFRCKCRKALHFLMNPGVRSVSLKLVCFCLNQFQVEVFRMLILPNHQQTQFQTIWWVFLCKNVVIVLTYTSSPWSPCILHQGLCWINNAFVLGVCRERRESNEAGTVLWYQQAAVAWVTKSRASDMNMGKSWRSWRGRDSSSSSWAANAAALCVWSEPLTLELLWRKKGARSRKESSSSSVRARQYWHYLAAGAPNPHLYLAHLAADLMSPWKVVGGVQKTGSSMWNRGGMEAGRKAGMKEWGGGVGVR